MCQQLSSSWPHRGLTSELGLMTLRLSQWPPAVQRLTCAFPKGTNGQDGPLEGRGGFQGQTTDYGSKVGRERFWKVRDSHLSLPYRCPGASASLTRAPERTVLLDSSVLTA